MVFPILDIVNVGMRILDRVLPDPAQKAAAQLELLKLQQSGDLAAMQAEVTLMTAQTDVNKVEAQSQSMLVAGWRPMVGWVCIVGLAYTFFLQPLLTWASGFKAIGIVGPPSLNNSDLFTLLAGILGLGTLRTYERVTGVIPPVAGPVKK